LAKGSPEFVFGGAGVAEKEVATDGAGEEKGVLGDVGNGVTEGAFGEFGDGGAIEGDATLLGVVEAREELEQSVLSGSGATDEGNGLAGFDFEADVVQDVDFGAVTKAEVFENKMASDGIGVAPGFEVYFAFLIEDIEDPFGGGEAVHEGLIDAVQAGDEGNAGIDPQGSEEESELVSHRAGLWPRKRSAMVTSRRGVAPARVVQAWSPSRSGLVG
jgi:hypothetical protein